MTSSLTVHSGFWSFLGSLFSGEDETLYDICGSIVRRARLGDQNAMAMMAATRDNAMNGNLLASVSMRLFAKYIDRNPVDSTMFGAESALDSRIDWDMVAWEWGE